MNIGSIDAILKKTPYKPKSALEQMAESLSAVKQPKAPSGVSKGSLKSAVKKVTAVKPMTPKQISEGQVMPEGYNITAKQMPGTLEGAMAEWDAQNPGAAKTVRDSVKYRLQSFVIDGVNAPTAMNAIRQGMDSADYRAMLERDNAPTDYEVQGSPQERQLAMAKSGADPVFDTARTGIAQAGQAIDKAIGQGLANSIPVTRVLPEGGRKFVEGIGSGLAQNVNPLDMFGMASQVSETVASADAEKYKELGAGLVRPVTVWFDPNATPEEKGSSVVMLAAMLAPVGIKGIPKLREVIRSMPNEASAAKLYDQVGEMLLKNTETAETGKALIAEKYKWEPAQAVEEAGPVKTPVEDYRLGKAPAYSKTDAAPIDHSGKPTVKGKADGFEPPKQARLEPIIPQPKAKGKKPVSATPTDVKIGDTIWRNKDTDAPVKVTGYLGEQNGRKYVSIEGTNTGVPLDEIVYDKPVPVITETQPIRNNETVVDTGVNKPVIRESRTRINDLIQREKAKADTTGQTEMPATVYHDPPKSIANDLLSIDGNKRLLNQKGIDPKAKAKLEADIAKAEKRVADWGEQNEWGEYTPEELADMSRKSQEANDILNRSRTTPKAKEPWKMTKDEYRRSLKVPEQESLTWLDNTDAHNVPYIRTDDGAIHAGKPGEQHVALAKRLAIPPERISNGGYYQNGDFVDGANAANLMRWVDSERSANQAGRHLELSNAVKEGKPVPDAVLNEYKGTQWADAEIARRATPPAKEAIPPIKQAGNALNSPVRDLTSPDRGTMPSTVEVAPLPGGTKLGAKELVLDLEKTVGKRIVQGATKKGTAGQYMPGTGKTVIRFEGDIPTAAHELSHSLDDMFSIGKQWHLKRAKSPFDKELFQPAFMETVSPRMNLRTKRAEAMAEWVTSYIKNPAEAERLAPEFAKFFKSRIPKETLSAIEAWSESVRKFAGETSLTRTKKQIQFSEPDKASAVQKVKTLFKTDSPENVSFRQEVDDDLAPISAATNQLKGVLGIDNLAPSKDPYLLARNHRYMQNRFNDILENGVRNTKDEVVGFPASDIFKELDTSSRKALDADFEDMIALAVSKRTVEKAGQAIAAGDTVRANRMSGVGGGIYSDLAEANAAIAELSANPARMARLEKAHQVYKKWTRSFLDYAVEKGLLSKEQVDGWIANNEEYIAMHRIFEDTPESFAPGARRLSNPKNPIKKMKGSTRKIENPIASSMADAYALIKNADRNETIKAIGDLIGANEKRGMHEGTPIDVSEIGYHVPASEKGPKLTYFVNGKPRHIKLDPHLMRALNDMSEVWNPHILLKVLQAPSQMLRTANTTAPPFLVRNFIRDTIQHAVITEHKAATKGVLKSISKSENSDLAYYGGGASRDMLLDNAKNYYQVQKKVMDSLVKDKDSMLMVPAKVKDWYMEAGKWSEITNRRTEFNAAYKHAKEVLGYGEYDAKLYAGQAARDLQDFMKSGRLVRALNRFIPFTNAKIQGMIRFGRGIKENPARTLKRALLYTAIPATAELVWNETSGASEEYDQLPEYLKYMFYNFKTPWGWVRIPKGHEIAAMGSFIERSARYALGDKHAFDGYAGQALGQNTIVETSNVTPPFLQALLNKDAFRDRDIVPYWEKDKAIQYREGTKNASNIGEAVQAITKIDARKADYLIQSYLGDWGRTASMLSDIGTKPLSEAKAVNAATGLMSDQSPYSLRDVQWLSDAYKDVGRKSPVEELVKAAADEKDKAKRVAIIKRLIVLAKQEREKAEANPPKPSSGQASAASSFLQVEIPRYK